MITQAYKSIIKPASQLGYSSPLACPPDKYDIIEASSQPASGRNGDTLIRSEIQGGFVRFSCEKLIQNGL